MKDWPPRETAAAFLDKGAPAGKNDRPYGKKVIDIGQGLCYYILVAKRLAEVSELADEQD